MFNWFIIIVIVLVIIVLSKISHLKHTRHKLFLLVFIFLLAFFAISFYLVCRYNNIDMTTVNGFTAGMKVYGGWLSNSYQNIAVLTGYAIGMDWKANNASVISNNTNNSSVNNIINDTKAAGVKIVSDSVDSIKKIKPNTPKPITSYK